MAFFAHDAANVAASITGAESPEDRRCGKPARASLELA